MTERSQYFITTDLLGSHYPAVICGDQTISYAQLFNAVAACRDKLKEIGIQANDRIAIFTPNSVEYIILLLGLWSIKAIACPLSTRLPQEAVTDQLQQINAKYIITPQKNTLDQSVIPTPQLLCSQLIGSSIPSSSELSLDDFSFTPDQMATICFTSGSSAKSKAALHTLGNHIASACGANEYIPVTPGDQWLLSIPLYHVGGLGILFRILTGGATLVIAKEGDQLSAALMDQAITHVSFVPTQLARMLAQTKIEHRLKDFKAILVGGSAIPNSLLQRSASLGLPIYTTYGMTEAASQIATAKYPSPAKVMDNTKVQISTEGEILVTGETLFCGYIDGNTIDLPLNEEGWFATGDVGTLTDDGCLTVTGRRDNMFISGGENIHPEEIEHHLCRIESIEQAIVIPVPHAEFGYRPIGFIRTSGKVTVNRKELSGFLGKHLPKFKIPDQFYAWPKEMIDDHSKINRKHLIETTQKKNLSLEQIN